LESLTILSFQENIVEAGKPHAEELGKYVTVNRQAPHTNHPTAAPTTAPKHLRKVIEPIVLKLPAIPALPELPAQEIPFHNLDCPNGDLLTFWKRTTAADKEYVTPYAKSGPALKYVTFEPGTRPYFWCTPSPVTFLMP
jgi:hypothetical protein